MSTAERLHLDEARIVTMRELSQKTSDVMEEVVQSGKPAVITRHGRFLAVLSPIQQEKVESFLLANLDEFLGIENYSAEETEAQGITTREVALESEVSVDDLSEGPLEADG